MRPPPIPEEGPFKDLQELILISVPDEAKRWVLLQSLKYFQEKLKEAQRAH